MRIFRRALIAHVMAGVVLVGPIAGTALAGPHVSAARGSCSVAPNPVAVGATWTMSGSNLGASKNFTVTVSDAGGTQYFFLASTSTGTMTFSWHSYYAGTSSVAIVDASGRKASTVASCSFQVV